MVIKDHFFHKLAEIHFHCDFPDKNCGAIDSAAY
jgi:hypothetical protein